MTEQPNPDTARRENERTASPTEETLCGVGREPEPNKSEEKRERNRGILVSAILILAIIFLAGVLLLFSIVLTEHMKPQASTPENVAGNVFETVAPSVVLIYGRNSDGYRYGTGFFLREDGYIATNAHVVDGYSDITVTLFSGEKKKASVVTQSDADDLALLRISGTGYPTVRIGKSSAARIGDLAVVIGNPAGADAPWTTTQGILSAVNRKISVEGKDGSAKEIPMLQTDATVNKGNSGGPLCNQNGEVIGIITSRLSGYDHISFAIPIDHAMEVFSVVLGDPAETK